MVHSDENKSIVCEYMNKEHNNDFDGSKRQIEADIYITAVTTIDYLKKELAKCKLSLKDTLKPKTNRWGIKWQ